VIGNDQAAKMPDDEEVGNAAEGRRHVQVPGSKVAIDSRSTARTPSGPTEALSGTRATIARDDP
jgi:hypothetical protein